MALLLFHILQSPVGHYVLRPSWSNLLPALICSGPLSTPPPHPTSTFRLKKFSDPKRYLFRFSRDSACKSHGGFRPERSHSFPYTNASQPTEVPRPPADRLLLQTRGRPCLKKIETGASRWIRVWQNEWTFLDHFGLGLIPISHLCLLKVLLWWNNLGVLYHWPMGSKGHGHFPSIWELQLLAWSG